jgi:spermidine synthase
LGRLAPRLRPTVGLYAVLQVLFALLLLPVLYLAFGARHLLGGVPGQGLGLSLILFSSFVLLIPVALVDGAMFTAGCHVDDACVSDAHAGAVGRVYVREAIGGILGGLAFTYLLVPYIPAVHIVLLLAAINLASALSLTLLVPSATGDGRRRLPSGAGIAGLLATALALLITPGAQALQRHFIAWQWRGHDVAFYGNSVYGNIVALRHGEQLTFMTNGLPALTVPVPDVEYVEDVVHLPLLFVPEPRRVLVLGGGLGGVLRELAQYPVERIDYAELDPLLIEAVASLPTPLTEAELYDPRVRIEQVDGRLLVHRLVRQKDAGQIAGQRPAPRNGRVMGRGSPTRYDLILINLPYPTTLQINRFHTFEFLLMVRELLAEGGVVALPTPGRAAYLSPGLRDLHGVWRVTLEAAFDHVRPIPGDLTLWLASPTALLDSPVDALVQRWEARALPTHVIGEGYIRYRLDGRWVASFDAALAEDDPPPINRDLRPSGLLAGMTHWSEMMAPELARYFALLGRMREGRSTGLLVLTAGALLLVVGAFIARRRSRRMGSALPAIAVTGFGGMTADLVIILAFQVLYGHVYQLIGLLTTAFMAGLSIGGLLMHRRVGRLAPGEAQRPWRWFLTLEGVLLAYWLAFPLALSGLAGAITAGALIEAVGPALLLLSALGGSLVGTQFPLASALQRLGGGTTSRSASLLYAADLAGGCVAAVIVSVALLPALGMIQTCLLVAALKAGSLLITLGGRRGRAVAA